MRKLALLLIVVFVAIFSIISQIDVIAQNGTCDLSLSSSTLPFGLLSPGDTSSDVSLDLSNTDSLDITDITIIGTDWSETFTGDFTHVSELSGQDYDTGMSPVPTPPSSPDSIGSLASGNSLTLYFKLRVPEDEPAGDYSQTITFDFTCEEPI